MINNKYNNRNNFKHNNPWDFPASYAYSYREQNIQENLVNNIQNSWRTHQRPFHRQNTEMQKEKNFPIFGQRPSVPYNENTLNSRNTVNFSNCFYQLDQFSDYVPKDIENEQFSSDMEFPQQEEKKKRIRVKAVSLPKRGQPGGLDDPLRKGLSGAGVRWYLRYLAEGNTPQRAKKLAMARKATGENIQNNNGIGETKKRNKEHVISEKNPDVKRIKTVPNNQEISELNPNEFQEIVYGIQIQILAKDDKKLLNKKDLTELENSIIDEVAKGWDTKIIFSRMHFSLGILSITCANKETANWLIERTPQLTTWKGVDLIVRTGEEYPKPKFVTMFLPKSKKENIDSALALLEAQNCEISTGSWKIINTTEINSGLIVSVIIDDKSIETMEKSEYNLNYRFGKIKIKANKNQSLFSIDQELFSQLPENKAEGSNDSDILCNRTSLNSISELEMKEKIPDSNSKELII